MNALLATLGSYGDVYPYVGLGIHLRQRGHRVTLLTNPHFAGLARKYDLDFVPIGTQTQYAQFADHPDLFDPRRSVSVFFDTLILPNVRSAYERLAEHVADGQTVIAAAIQVFAARLLQEKAGVPVATIHTMPMAFKSAHEMPRNAMVPFPDWLPLSLKRLYWWVADKAVIDRMIAPELNTFRRELGLPPVERIMTRWGHSPQLVIALFPAWFAEPQPDWPPHTHVTGFPLFDEDAEKALPGEVRAFLADGDPPIVFMPGSLMQQAEHFFAVAVEACQALGRRAILLSRYRHHLPGTLPDGIRHFDYLPFRQLLPAVALLVHHGGIGTCAQALAAGVPQLIHPMAYDQYDNAWRLKRLGVGDWIIPQAWEAPALAEKLAWLSTTMEVNERCQDLARQMAAGDPLLDASRLIESLLSPLAAAASPDYRVLP